MVAQNRPLVYGGGTMGVMGFVSDAVLEAGGDVTGVIPGAMLEAGGEADKTLGGDAHGSPVVLGETSEKVRTVSLWARVRMDVR